MKASKIITVDLKTDSNALTLEIFFETVLEENIKSFIHESNIFDDCKNETFKSKLNIYSKYRSGNLTLYSENVNIRISISVFTSFINFQIEKKRIETNLEIFSLELNFRDIYKFEIDVENFLNNFYDTFLGDNYEA